MGFKPLVRDGDLVPSRDEVKGFRRGIDARDVGGILGFFGRFLKRRRKLKDEREFIEKMKKANAEFGHKDSPEELGKDLEIER